MELYKIAIRVIAAFVFLLLIIRISGKRTISEAQPLDFAVALILGDLIDDAVWAEIPFNQFICGAGTIMVLHMIISYVVARSDAAYEVVVGKPAFLLRNGHLTAKTLSSEQISRREAESMLRVQGLSREEWPEVNAAFIEPAGSVSVLKRRSDRPVQRRDL